MSFKYAMLSLVAFAGLALQAAQDERGVVLVVEGQPELQFTRINAPTSHTFTQTLDLKEVDRKELQDGVSILQKITLQVNRGGAFREIVLEGVHFRESGRLPNFTILFSEDRSEIVIHQEEYGPLESLIEVINTVTLYPAVGEYEVTMVEDLHYIQIGRAHV